MPSRALPGRNVLGPLPGVSPPANVRQPSGLMNTPYVSPRLSLALTIRPFYHKNGKAIVRHYRKSDLWNGLLSRAGEVLP